MMTTTVVVCAGLGLGQDIGNILGNEELYRRPPAFVQMEHDTSDSASQAWNSPYCYEKQRTVASGG